MVRIQVNSQGQAYMANGKALQAGSATDTGDTIRNILQNPQDHKITLTVIENPYEGTFSYGGVVIDAAAISALTGKNITYDYDDNSGVRWTDYDIDVQVYFDDTYNYYSYIANIYCDSSSQKWYIEINPDYASGGAGGSEFARSPIQGYILHVNVVFEYVE